ncbi:DUF2156 domain-containing protein [Cryobacterium sp. SO2]|uniref:bifunctional lysylphosphatidylglycerol flippase/synthetase MprF n=1 Tax=Cryobacterium sp. SO2 TaxID=1897060 RepID=UPI00223E2686|nr:DUF2156 domain-containing protein [Cryobacterium sp. SO2]WEO79094.1 DUF2156 domain-containing protein [Cryobacterium sp. SO2]
MSGPQPMRMRRLGRQVHRAPFSVAVAGLLLITAVVTGPLTGPSSGTRLLFGTGYHSAIGLGHWWSPLTSVFLVDNAAELVLAVLGALVLLGAAERLLGTGRTVLAFGVTAVIGTGLGLVLQDLGVAGGELWSRGVRELWALDPFTPILGAIMAASGFAGPLWRRRIRVLTLAATFVFLLYSGQPTDLYRLLAVLAGLVLGVALRPRRREAAWRRSSDHETRTLIGAIVAVLAVGPVVTVVSGGRFGILAPLGLLLTQEVPSANDVVDRCLLRNITRQCVHELTLERVGGVGPILVSLLPLIALLVAAYGLSRGRRFAAWLAIVVNTGMACLGAWYYGLLPVSGQPYSFQWRSGQYWEVAVVLVVSVLVPAGTAIAIALTLRHFPVRTRPGCLRRFALITGGGLLGLSVLYLGLGWLLRDHFRPAVTLLDLVTDLPERFIPVGFLRLERLSFLPGDPPTVALYQWVGPAFWLLVIGGAILALRTGAVGARPEDQARVRRLLLAGGGGSLAHMATWEGTSLWFTDPGSPARSAAVAYRVVNGVAITVAEPIGVDPAAEHARASAIVAAFARMCDDHGWVPVFYSLHDPWRPVFERMGWQTMAVGEETVLRPHDWATTGRKWQDIRSSVNRAHKLGIRAVWTSHRALPLWQSAQIAEISEQWVQEKGLPELGFTLGGLDELRDPEVRLMLAIDAHERILAVTSWLPSYRDGAVIGWTLDFMRRRSGTMNGVMEFLISETAALLKADPTVEFLSLSAAPLARAETLPATREGGSVAERMLDFIGRSLEPVYGFRSLFVFKRKFQPEFHALFLAYPDPVALPAIGVALARAYLPTLTMRQAAAFVRSLT